jgi:site-specific DNA-cytosine methylase
VCFRSLSQHAQDLFICGFPCQPNSVLRPGRFRDHPPTAHRLYDVAHMVVAAVHRNLPRAAILENVMGMRHRSKAVDGPDELTKFASLISGHGKYHFAAVRVTLGAWTAAERERQRPLHPHSHLISVLATHCAQARPCTASEGWAPQTGVQPLP